MPPSQWQLARQRDFSGGETLAKLPEKVGRNQLIRMENCIISPEGLLTESWQMDQPMFTNVSGGVVIAPIAGSALFTVYGAVGNDIISFTFDPSSTVPYDMANAEGYAGYKVVHFDSPVTILGISHGTPFLGKNYCCASAGLYVVGELTVDPAALDFGTVQNTFLAQETVTVTNTSSEVVTLTNAFVTGPDGGRFGITGAFPQTLAPAAEYSFDITCNPSGIGDLAAMLVIPNTLGVLQVELSGVSDSMVSATPVLHDYGIHPLGVGVTAAITTVTNSGPNPVTVSSIVMSGDDPAAFTASDFLPATIDAGTSKPISAVFIPSAAKSYHAEATIRTSVGDVPNVSLSGSGAVLMAAVPSSIAAFGISDWSVTYYSTTIHNYSTTDALTVTAVQLPSDFFVLNSPVPLPSVIPPGGTLDIVFKYTYPYRGYVSYTTLRVTTNWGKIEVPVTMGGVS